MAKKPRNKKYNRRKIDHRASKAATYGTMLIQAQGLGKDGKNLDFPRQAGSKRGMVDRWQNDRLPPHLSHAT